MYQAAKALQTISNDLQSGPIGLIGMRIAMCLNYTRDLRHMYIAYLLSVLGCQLTSLDYQPEAEIVHRRALCLAIRALGRNHYHLACAMDWLAFTLMRQGNYKESVLLCYSSMHITVNHVGVWHPYTANCYLNLGTVLDLMGLKEHAGRIRSAGRTIFLLAKSPTMVETWQNMYKAMSEISVHRSIIPPQDCSSSCVSLESGVTKNVDGIIFDLLKDIELEIDPPQCMPVEVIDICEDIQPRDMHVPVDELSKGIGCAVEDTEDGFQGADASHSVMNYNLTRISAPPGSKDEKSSGSMEREGSEKDFTIGVGRSSADVLGVEQA